MSDPPRSVRRRRLGPIGRLVRVAWQAGGQLVAHEGFELSGYAAFTALLSLFPFLLFLTALAGFVGDANVAERVVNGALEFAPYEVVRVLRPVIFELLTQRHGNLLTLGIVFALWSASSGLEALRTILNRSYGLIETRPFWVLRPQSVLMVVLGTVATILASGTIIFGPLLLNLLHWVLEGPQLGQTFGPVLRYGLAGGLVTGMLVLLHLGLPNARLALWRVWPGAVVSTLLWLVGAGLFSVYVESFADYSVTYGSLGGIILTLLFFYITAIIFAFGAEINAALLRNAAGAQA